MVPAVLAGTRGLSEHVYLGPSLTTLFAKSATADCSFATGSGSQKESVIFVYLSIVELMQLVLTIVLPKYVPIPESARERLVERMLFHGAIQAGAYSVLDHIAPAASMLEFGDQVFSQSIALRTMIALDCLAGHEIGHWQAATGLQGGRIEGDFKERIMGLAAAGAARLKDVQSKRYPEDAAAASAAVQNAFEHWWANGWPEIECDLLSIRSAYLLAVELKIPIASFVATISTLYQVMGALRFAGALIRGRDNDAGPRASARSIIFESVINDMVLNIGVDPDTRSYAVEYRRRANRRFVELIGGPLVDRADALSAVFNASQRPSRQSIVASMARHKFAPRPQGHFHFCVTGSGP